MSPPILALIAATGLIVGPIAFAYAVNRIAARWERRDRARFMQAYYPQNHDAPGAHLATSDLPSPYPYGPERMW